MRQRWSRLTGTGCAAFVLTAGLTVVAAPAAGAAPAPGLDVKAAEQALATQQVYRAPGAIAQYDAARVTAELRPGYRVLIAPPIGVVGRGRTYASSQDYYNKVEKPLEDWSNAHSVKLIEVTGLDVEGDVGEYVPSDLPTLRTQIAYRDVTNELAGILHDERTQQLGTDAAPPPTVAPTAAQLAPVVAGLGGSRVYAAPGASTPPVPSGLTGFTFRVAAFPALAPGQPFVDYAPALAKSFPKDDVIVSYGAWLEVAGPHQEQLNGAREYLLGEYETQILKWGVGPDQLTGLILQYISDLTTRKPFSRPIPPPFQVRNVIAGIAPWLLLGSAVLLAGYTLLRLRQRRATAERGENLARNQESARAAAAIAALSGDLLAATDVMSDVDTGAVDKAAERQQTAGSLFRQARTADAMRKVREVAEAGRAALR